MTSSRIRAAAAFLVPIGLLAASWISAPYVSDTAVFAWPPPDEPIIRLHRRGAVTYYYTRQDLLHPEAFGRPGAYLQAVAFDISAADEGARGLLGETWIRQAGRALAGYPAESGNETSDEGADVILSDFLRLFAGPPREARGGVVVFEVPPEAKYRDTSGVTHLFALAVKDQPKATPAPLRGQPPKLDVALAATFREASDRNVNGIGIPFMAVSQSLGVPAPHRRDSWRHLLEQVDTAAAQTGIRSVVFGGWGLAALNREQIDSAFREAYQQRRLALGSAGSLAHEEIRLAAIVLLAAFGAALYRRESLPVKRIVAAIMVAAGLGATVPALFDWLDPIVSIGGAAALAIKATLALVAGVLLTQIAKFDPEKELAQTGGADTNG